MAFNSLEYLFFFTIVFFVLWFFFRDNLKLQNIFLLITNYIFYGWWDWRFLSLIIFISAVNYFTAIQIGKTDYNLLRKRRKSLLVFGLAINLSLLGIFKYFNFFAQSTADLLHTFGFGADALTINIILPIGISFYTFQTMSYTLDVYGTKIEPTKDIISFFAYISFFPLILAGPIERANNLLKQFCKKREFNYNEAADGMRQILWGLFKKIVIADNCAILVNEIFNKHETQPASVLIMGSIYYAFQIYGDFSGYSDIAIGSAKLLGFKLMTNFKTPYFSRDMMEFWRRWHISLSTWFRDYLFLSTAYSLTRKLSRKKYFGIRSDKIVFCLATMLTFLACGLWHGANWNFIIWGGLIGIYFIPLILTNQNRKNLDKVAEGNYLPSPKEVIQMGITFALTCLSWIFFRAENLTEAFKYLGGIFTHNFLPSNYDFFPRYMIFLITFFLLSEWFLFRHDDFLQRFSNLNAFTRRVIYAITFVLIFLFIHNEASSFIYFQF